MANRAKSPLHFRWKHSRAGIVEPKYFKSAFLNQWNMLGLAGAAGFAVLSGFPEIALPILAAGELLCVALLGAHPKFRKFVDAQKAKEERQANRQTSADVLQHIVKSLPAPILAHF